MRLPSSANDTLRQSAAGQRGGVLTAVTLVFPAPPDRRCRFKQAPSVRDLSFRRRAGSGSVTGESLTTRSNTVTFRGLQVAFGECGRVSSGEGVRVARSEAPNDAPERRRPGRRSAHMSDRRNVRACGRQERVGVSSV
jgi:hypothetical protein